MFKKLLFLTAVFAFAGFVLVSCSSDDKSTDPAPDKVFKILSPNGGEIYQKGDEEVIKFKNELEGDVKISLYKGDEYVSPMINAAETNKDSSFWNIPVGLDTGTDYRIKIQSLTDSTKFDFSDANFTVAPAGEYIIVKSTNGGDIWLKGQTKHITWIDNISGTVDIFLYKNGISIAELTSISPEPSDGDYAWVIPSDGTFAEGADYQFLIVSTANAGVYDFSDNYFCLATNDNTQNIVGSWDATGTWAKWDSVLEFYANGTWLNVLYTSEKGTWTMTGNGLKMNFDGNSMCFLAIVNEDNMTGSMAEGDDYGTWSAVRLSPEVTAPNGGEVWLRGTTKTITWTPVSKGDVTLSLTDSTGVVQNIATVADSLGTYDWAIPSTITPNADYKIKITQEINSASNDESDNCICISSDETVDIFGEWQVNYFWSKDTMFLNFKSDNTWELVGNTTYTGVWSLVGNGLAIVPDYNTFKYIGIVNGDKMKGTTQQPPTYTGIWNANRILTVTAPNGGNVYQPSEVVSITWAENLSAESAIIDLYENDVLSRNIGTVNINNFTSFNWTVPSNLVTSTKYKIRITSAVDSDIYDESDTYFTVNGVSATPAIEDETFDDGLAQNWSGLIGNWSVADSAYTVNSDSLTVTSAEYTTALTGNYMVEAKMKKVSGSQWFYGLFVNGDNSTLTGSGYWYNNVLIVLRPDGYYGFFVMVDGTELGSWYTSSALNTGMDVWNTLKVIVNNDTGDYHVYINGQYIQTHNNSSFNSGKLGLNFYDNTLLGSGAIDYVKVSPVNKTALKKINIIRAAELRKGSSVK